MMDSTNESASSSATPTPTTNGAFSLENILGDEHETLEHPAPQGGWDEEMPEKAPIEGF